MSQLDALGMKEVRPPSNTPEPVHSTPDSLSVDQLSQATRLALKMQRVKEQMDSVLVNTQNSLLLLVLDFVVYNVTMLFFLKDPHHGSSSFEPGTACLSAS